MQIANTQWTHFKQWLICVCLVCTDIKHLLVYTDIKHLLDEIESNIQFIASGQGNIGPSDQLDVGQGQVQ